MELDYSTTGFVHLLNVADSERNELILSATKKFMQLYPTLGNSIERARFFNELVDDFQEKQLDANPIAAGRIYCQNGCSKCCSLPVGVTEDEARSVLSFALENRIFIDADRLSRQREAGKEGWSSLDSRDKVCVFLSPQTKNCMVYSCRPNSCRNHLVLDTDEFCGPGNSSDLQSYAIVLSHACTSATYNCCKTGIFADFIV